MGAAAPYILLGGVLMPGVVSVRAWDPPSSVQWQGWTCGADVASFAENIDDRYFCPR